MQDKINAAQQQVDDFNTIARFLAARDIPVLNRETLEEFCGVSQADLLVFMVSSVPYTAEIAAELFRQGVAKKIMVVGGKGHSTEILWDTIRKHDKYNTINVEEQPEADIVRDMMTGFLGIDTKDILVENKSTHCGGNASEALKVAKENGFAPKSLILMQDPTMQIRTFASFQQAWKEQEEVCFINYAPFIPQLTLFEGCFAYHQKDIPGLWDMKRFLSLIMGEIPRILDDENGYGPKGKGFIAHIDVPNAVISAFERVLTFFDNLAKLRS